MILVLEISKALFSNVLSFYCNYSLAAFLQKSKHQAQGSFTYFKIQECFDVSLLSCNQLIRLYLIVFCNKP